MKILHPLFSYNPFTSMMAAGIAALLFTGCSTDSWFRQADSPLPIEVRQSGSGQVQSFRAYESGGRLYVAGSARRNALSSGAHVDVQLIAANGAVIAEDQDDINAPHPRPGGGKRYQASYTTSFPLSQARGAVKIRVICHSGSHS